jgi:hypothetical protein
MPWTPGIFSDLNVTATYRHVELTFRVSGYYKLAQAIKKANDGETYRGIFKESIEAMLEEARDYAAKITHRGTSGKLAESHEWEYDSHKMTGNVYLNQRVVWAKGSTLMWPFIYGVYEHARGGSHAFYQRTISEAHLYLGGVGMSKAIRVMEEIWG